MKHQRWNTLMTVIASCGMSIAFAMVACLATAGEPANPSGKPRLVAAELVGIYRRPTRPYILRAKFQTTDKDHREIVLDIPAGQADSKHRRTLVSVLQACRSRDPMPALEDEPSEFPKPRLFAVFNVPEDGLEPGRIEFDEIELLRLDLKED